MHDIRGLEQLGIVAVGVATTEFKVAAAAQSEALGYDPAVVFVQHPIQDRTNEEIRALADSAVEQILANLKA
jgi:alkanesulfonate monooxygenase SsuD/methylene tetrahydromethanopterin reductase-like flavin-dependent oxidoreductase (luciferase family)